MTKRSLLSVPLAIVLACPAFADEHLPWPQFRGPGGSGVADDQRPPVEFGTDTNVAWKVDVPAGLSSPIVVGDLLVLTAFEDGKLLTIAYRRADGGEAWRAGAPYEKLEPYHPTEGSPAASTPATDGQRIVSYFGSCGLFCYDLSGHELWSYKLPPAATVADFGTGVSPIIADGAVILLRDESNDPKILAVDLASGNRLWEQPRESKSGFGTPVVWNLPGARQIVAPGFGQMIGYDLATGEKQWFVAGMPSACCTTPVVADELLLFAGWSPGDPQDKDFQMPTFEQLLGGGNDADGDGSLSKAESERTMFKDFFDNNDPNKDGQITRAEWDQMLEFIAASRNSAFALRAGGRGDVTESHVVWKATQGLPYVPSAIAYRGQYLMVKDGGIVTAYDIETGDQLYQKRAVASGSYYASPIAAGGNVYFVSLADGAVTVLEGGADPPRVVAKNAPLGERVSATPAIADNTIYLRTAGRLYAFAAPR